MTTTTDQTTTTLPEREFVRMAPSHVQRLEKAATAWHRKHVAHPAWCADHDYGDGSTPGVHQSETIKVVPGVLPVDISADGDAEPFIRIFGTDDYVIVPLSDVAPLVEALQRAAHVLTEVRS